MTVFAGVPSEPSVTVGKWRSFLMLYLVSFIHDVAILVQSMHILVQHKENFSGVTLVLVKCSMGLFRQQKQYSKPKELQL